MNTTTPEMIAEIGDIRIDPVIAERMVRAVIEEMGDDRIADRINDERDFLLAAIRTAQDVLTVTTLAQTVSGHVPFKPLLAARTFAGGNADLQVIGQALADKIAKQPRIADDEISDELLSTRYKEIAAAI